MPNNTHYLFKSGPYCLDIFHSFLFEEKKFVFRNSDHCLPLLLDYLKWARSKRKMQQQQLGNDLVDQLMTFLKYIFLKHLTAKIRRRFHSLLFFASFQRYFVAFSKIAFIFLVTFSHLSQNNHSPVRNNQQKPTIKAITTTTLPSIQFLQLQCQFL